MGLTEEQERVLQFDKQRLIVSASAGSGKTFVLIKYITDLIIRKKVPLNRFLVLTFTKAAAKEMKERLLKALLQEKRTSFLFEQIDEIPTCDIRTIDSFCEKIIKQYLSKTELDETFTVIDEKQNLILKKKAFDRAVEKFSTDLPEEFSEIFLAFKQNKKSVFNCLCKIKDFLDCQEDDEYLMDYFLNNSEKFFDKACACLNNFLRKEFIDLGEDLFKYNSLDKDLQAHADYLYNLISVPLTEDYVENINMLNNIEMKRFPSKRGNSEDKLILKAINDKIKKIIELCQKYDFSTNMLKKQQLGTLSVAILKLEKEFLSIYKKIKHEKDFVDFADSEKIVLNLLHDEEILKNLQNNYDYIFIDEYQDTNKLQEAIIKPISQKGMFVAVGDLKQGIYGFRNASMDIMLQDIENFSVDENSETIFLKSNFRSDKTILDFINFIFDKIMTKDSSGVDYKNTSMLKGEQIFQKSKLGAVEVFIVKEDKKESEKCADVYSVREDHLTPEIQNAESDLIIEKIKEFLNSEIYDISLKRMRKVQPNDIAVLFRSRNQTMLQCFQKLKGQNINAISDFKENLFDSISIKIICNLLKLTISLDDDIALVSVMKSPFGGFTLTELAQFACQVEGNSFAEKIMSQRDNKKIDSFLNYVEQFKFLCNLKGIRNALREQIVAKNFFEKLDYDLDERSERISFDNFCAFISSINADFNVPQIIQSYENSEIINTAVSQSQDSVLLTTIHSTKGLEYPIVILSSCGESLDRIQTETFAISREFGLGTCAFNNLLLTKSPSPVLNAIRLENKRKNWIDEVMIFYVALTRAKNHLVLCGKLKNIELKLKLEECNSYFDLLFYSLGSNVVGQIQDKDKYENDLFRLEVINNITRHGSLQIKVERQDNSIYQKGQNYLNYSYHNLNYELKNSVSVINEKENADVNFSKQGAEREKSIIEGNEMHLALKLLDFDKITTISDLEAELEKIKDKFTSEIDLETLQKNIMILKDISQGGVVYKEKAFVMSMPIGEVFANDEKAKIIIQGIIDFFVVKKDSIIVIDYKFTNNNDIQQIRAKYKRQVELYQKALEKAFPNKKISKYLLSLKKSKLISI